MEKKSAAVMLRIVEKLGTKLWFGHDGVCSRLEGPQVVYAIIGTKNMGESWWRDGKVR